MSLFTTALQRVIAGKSLEEDEAFDLMLEILHGKLQPEQIAGLLTALATKGESLPEVRGFVRAMRSMATYLHTDLPVVDTCGTGGDGAHTFNISTTSAFVVAGAGVPVAKHHNRSVSSRSGSADLLEKLDIDIQMPLKEVERCVNEEGIGFCFAPLFHASMRHAAPARKALGVRTIFNILGPLLNPFIARRQVIGVFSAERQHFIAELLRDLGSERVLVLHGNDGLDEATLTDTTRVVELINDDIREYTLDPRALGFKLVESMDLVGGDADHNAHITRRILAGKRGPQLDIVILNSALAIYAGQDDITLEKAVDLARESVLSGAARQKLERLVEISRHTQPEMKVA